MDKDHNTQRENVANANLNSHNSIHDAEEDLSSGKGNFQGSFEGGITNAEGCAGEEIDELEELRRQINDLRSELSHSRIVNDKVIRQSMRGRSSWLGTFVKLEAVTIPILGFFFWCILYFMDASLWPAYVFVIIAAVSTWFDTYTMTIRTKALLTMPMSELKNYLVKQKKQRLIQLLIETPLTILWVIWFFFAVKSTLREGSIAYEFINDGFSIGLFGGLFFGLLAVAIIYIKAQNTNDALIDAIDTTHSEEK